MTDVETARTTESKPNEGINGNKIRSDNKKICNRTRLKQFDKELEEKYFFTSEAKLAFFRLRQVFIKSLVLY